MKGDKKKKKLFPYEKLSVVSVCVIALLFYVLYIMFSFPVQVVLVMLGVRNKKTILL